MQKLKSAMVQMRAADGSVVKLDPALFYELMEPHKNMSPKVRKRRARFLPGVNPKWDAEQALREARIRRGADPNGFTG